MSVLSDQELHKLMTDVAVLVKELDRLFTRMKEQDVILAELKSKADQGKGVLWVLVGLGSAASMFAGFMMANAKSFIQFLAR